MNILVFDSDLELEQEHIDQYDFTLKFNPKMDMSRINGSCFIDFYTSKVDEYEIMFIVKCMSLGARIAIYCEDEDICTFWSRYCGDVVCNREAGLSEYANREGTLRQGPFMGSREPAGFEGRKGSVFEQTYSKNKESGKITRGSSSKDKKDKLKKESQVKEKAEKKPLVEFKSEIVTEEVKVKEPKKKEKVEKPKKMKRVEGNLYTEGVSFELNPDRKRYDISELKDHAMDGYKRALDSLNKKESVEFEDEMITISMQPSEETKERVSKIKNSLFGKKEVAKDAAYFVDEEKTNKVARQIARSGVSITDLDAIYEQNSEQRNVTISKSANDIVKHLDKKIYTTVSAYLLGNNLVTETQLQEARDEIRLIQHKSKLKISEEDILVRNGIIEEETALEAIREVHNVEVLSSESLANAEIHTDVYPSNVCKKYIFAQLSKEPNILVSTINNNLVANLSTNFNGAQIKYALALSILARIQEEISERGWDCD